MSEDAAITGLLAATLLAACGSATDDRAERAAVRDSSGITIVGMALAPWVGLACAG